MCGVMIKYIACCRPLDIFFDSCQQIRNQLLREIDHSLIQQKARCLGVADLGELVLLLFGTLFFQHFKNLLHTTILHTYREWPTQSYLGIVEVDDGHESVNILLLVNLGHCTNLRLIANVLTQGTEVDVLALAKEELLLQEVSYVHEVVGRRICEGEANVDCVIGIFFTVLFELVGVLFDGLVVVDLHVLLFLRILGRRRNCLFDDLLWLLLLSVLLWSGGLLLDNLFVLLVVLSFVLTHCRANKRE